MASSAVSSVKKQDPLRSHRVKPGRIPLCFGATLGSLCLRFNLGNPGRFPPPHAKRLADHRKPTVSLTGRCRLQAQHASPRGHLYACLDQLGGGEEQFQPDLGIPWWQ